MVSCRRGTGQFDLSNSWVNHYATPTWLFIARMAAFVMMEVVEA